MHRIVRTRSSILSRHATRSARIRAQRLLIDLTAIEAFTALMVVGLAVTH